MQHKKTVTLKTYITITASVLFLIIAIVILFKTGLSVDMSHDTQDTPHDDAHAESQYVSSVVKYVPVSHTDIPLPAISQNATEPQISSDGIFDTVTFAAAGDILIHTNVYKYAKELAAGTPNEYDFKPIFANIKDIISSVDIAYVNQETPSAGKERGHSGYPRFNTPDEIADAVVDCGFDIVNIANNHMLDMGASGLERNIDFWSSKPVTLIGGFKNSDDYNNIRIIEKNGISIALLSYTYGTNGLILPSSSELVIPYEDYDEIDRQTKEARELADVVIVSMHWGHEDHFMPSENQKTLARMMADNGVDVILGMHPHVLQPIEWLERNDGGKTLVIYSLGNLISTMMYSRNMLGGICTFTIVKAQNGNITIEKPELIPTMTYYKSSFTSPTIYLYKNFDDTMLSLHGSKKYDSHISRKYLNGIITRGIDRQFITDPYYDTVYGD